MDTQAKLTKLFNHIREHGVPRLTDHRPMGGIWSADMWDLNGFMAQLADDGATQGIGDERGIIGWTTYGRPVDYWKPRTEADLLAAYLAFFPETA